ncbi:hypothetical protein JNEOFJEA_00223 [Aeromonas phage UP87]|nr:hypothetical protein JNEOFJEA_00223 [Aeromonas phage UP87]UYD58416.1 hypothetical protein IPAKJDPM_00073 [Aeromonas phage avDM14-QBC]UYD58632.1 hypothetical protein HNNIDBEH_00039 [Aeromonas phage avDM10-HWA]UYD59065.1 hypothetical protein OFOPOMKI_00215 [Aeromonas phage avDM7-IJDJ]
MRPMKHIGVALLSLLVMACATKPKELPTPQPVHKLEVTWKATADGATLSFEDYNRLGVWLEDVNRYIKDQKSLIQICEGRL